MQRSKLLVDLLPYEQNAVLVAVVIEHGAEMEPLAIEIKALGRDLIAEIRLVAAADILHHDAMAFIHRPSPVISEIGFVHRFDLLNGGAIIAGGKTDTRDFHDLHGNISPRFKNREALRSFTIRLLHASEFCFFLI